MKREKFSKKIYFFVGTTTELIKLAPTMKELESRKVSYKVITSGQTKVSFEELQFLINKSEADIKLDEKTDKSSLFLFGFWFLKTLFKIPFLNKEFSRLNKKNSYFVVHGDPVSSLLGALLARYYGLNLVHVESGLRSFSYLEPFPEELCRMIISRLADIHFCPNQWSVDNLAGVSGVKINTYQNTQIESYLSALKKNKLNKNLSKVTKQKYFVMILHRQEHVIFGKEDSKKLIKYIFNNFGKNLHCVFITHATTLNFLKSTNFKLRNNLNKKINFVPRLSYLDFINLMSNSEFIVTDGGSNQEEAYYMGLPCLILRNRSERIEGLGKNSILSQGKMSTVKAFLNNYKNYRQTAVKISVRPSKIVVDYLLDN